MRRRGRTQRTEGGRQVSSGAAAAGLLGSYLGRLGVRRPALEQDSAHDGAAHRTAHGPEAATHGRARVQDGARAAAERRDRLVGGFGFGFGFGFGLGLGFGFGFGFELGFGLG